MKDKTAQTRSGNERKADGPPQTTLTGSCDVLYHQVKDIFKDPYVGLKEALSPLCAVLSVLFCLDESLLQGFIGSETKTLYSSH